MRTISCGADLFDSHDLTSRWPKAVSSPPSDTSTSSPSDTSTSSWYLLQCCPNHEVRAAEHLAQRGFEVYLPSTTEPLARLARLKRTYERPIFCRYLFARFRYADRWRILSVPGIQIVTFDNQPATLSDFEIERVRALEQKLRSPRPKAQRGKVVRIQVGRLTLCGTLSGHKRGLDVMVLRKAA